MVVLASNTPKRRRPFQCSHAGTVGFTPCGEPHQTCHSRPITGTPIRSFAAASTASSGGAASAPPAAEQAATTRPRIAATAGRCRMSKYPPHRAVRTLSPAIAKESRAV
jgi:hypothetical protein